MAKSSSSGCNAAAKPKPMKGAMALAAKNRFQGESAGRSTAAAVTACRKRAKKDTLQEEDEDMEKEEYG